MGDHKKHQAGNSKDQRGFSGQSGGYEQAVWSEDELRAVQSAWMGMCEVFNKSISEVFTKTYFAVLTRYSAQKVLHAIDQAILTCEYFPRIAKLVQLIDEPAEVQARRGWELVRKAVASLGYNRSIMFEDQKIHETIRLIGGWNRICMCREKEIPFIRKEFIDTYAKITSFKTGQRIIGDTEADNRRKGFLDFIPPTYVINESGIRSVPTERLLTHEEKKSGYKELTYSDDHGEASQSPFHVSRSIKKIAAQQ